VAVEENRISGNLYVRVHVSTPNPKLEPQAPNTTTGWSGRDRGRELDFGDPVRGVARPQNPKPEWRGRDC